MPTKLEKEKTIRRFLFGEMQEEERFEFEERFILDEALFDEVKVVEDELIEKYVREWMDPAERSKFEKKFLTTSKRRERVEFSRQMISRIEEQKEAVAVKKTLVTASDETIWNELAAIFLTPKTAMAGALTLVIAVFGGWVLYRNLSDKQQVVKNENGENPTDTSTPTPQDTRETIPDNDQNDEVNENIEKPQDVGNQSENQKSSSKEKRQVKQKNNSKPKKPKVKEKKTPVPVKTPPIKKKARTPFLALFSGTLRSGGKNKVLTLPKEAKGATLQLNLDGVDYKIYSAQVTNADGNVVYQRGKLKARKSKITFNVPAKNLKNGDYIVKLNGKNDSGENESVADFQFRVKR